MDTKSRESLSSLLKQMHNESLITCIEELEVGDVVYYDLDRRDGIVPNNGYDSRLKYVVVAGAKSNAKEICAVLINSDNDYSVSPDWQAEQYLIRKEDYPEFLEHDSWIDCTDSKELKVKKIIAKKAEKKGRLNSQDLANVMKHLKENDFIDQHTRKVYGIDKF